jgi:hypothetical protein
LWDFIDWEVGDINGRAELGLKWCTDFAKLVP